MEVRYVDSTGSSVRDPDDLSTLLSRDGSDGFVWIDVPAWDGDTDERLAVLGLHPMVKAACQRRNYVPTLHRYRDHGFITAQSPLSGASGHIHLLELDQVIGQHFLLTVHGPINPEVPIEEALVETRAVQSRIDGDRFHPTSPVELSYAITSGVARRQSALVQDVAGKLPGLEKEVMVSRLRDPEALLERMFLIRHELSTTRTMAAQCHDVWLRMASLPRLEEADRGFARDLADQFDRVRSLADGEAQFLFGVIELYQTMVHTKMTVAMERLAVIAAVTLPVTAIASVYGMNMIVNQRTHYLELAVIVLAMLTISAFLLRWARRQGWW